MEVREEVSVVHNVEVVLYGPDGQVKEHRVVHNLTPTVGKNAIAEQLLAAPSKEKPTHMAIGKKSTEAKAEDTTLAEELDRNALTSKTRSANVVTMVGTWAPGDGTGEIKEAGIFNAASSGDLYHRAVFGVITKEAGDELVITWKATYG